MSAVPYQRKVGLRLRRPRISFHRAVIVTSVALLLGRGVAITLVDAWHGVKFVAGKIAGCQ